MAVLVPFTLLGFWIFVYVASSTFLQTTTEDLLIVHLAVWRVRGRGGGTPLWLFIRRWMTGLLTDRSTAVSSHMPGVSTLLSLLNFLHHQASLRTMALTNMMLRVMWTKNYDYHMIIFITIAVFLAMTSSCMSTAQEQGPICGRTPVLLTFLPHLLLLLVLCKY